MPTLADTNDPNTPHTEPPGPVTEAIIIACALAWEGNPLAGLDVERAYVERMHDNARSRHPDAELLTWRTYIDPAMWQLTWGWARRVVRQHYPGKSGVDNLPLRHEDLPDPAAIREATTP